MINPDFGSLSDYRSDGRTKEELRQVGIRLGFDGVYDGSASFKIGLTEVECRVIGPIEVITTLPPEEKTRRPFCCRNRIQPGSFLYHAAQGRTEVRQVKLQLTFRDFDDFAEGLRRAIEANLVLKSDRNVRIKLILSILTSNGCNLSLTKL